MDARPRSRRTDVHARERSQHLEKSPDEPLVGLALSGGGIRSACFGLGVLQALQKLELFQHLDYVSTVSGGGYIGGWLQAAVGQRRLAARHRARRRGAARNPLPSRLQQLPDAEAGAVQRRHLGGGRQQPAQPDPQLHDPQPLAPRAALPAVAGRGASSGNSCPTRPESGVLMVRPRGCFVLVVAASIANIGAAGARGGRHHDRARRAPISARVYATVIVPGLVATWLVSTVDVGVGPRPAISGAARTRAGRRRRRALATPRLWTVGLIARLRVAAAQTRASRREPPAVTWAVARSRAGGRRRWPAGSLGTFLMGLATHALALGSRAARTRGSPACWRFRSASCA